MKSFFIYSNRTKIEIIKPQKGILHKILYDLEKTDAQNINKKLFENNSNKKNLFIWKSY